MAEMRFTITETVSFAAGEVAFWSDVAAAGAFSLPGRTLRGCSEMRGDFAMGKILVFSVTCR
jgi:hypothetical protein